MNITPDQLVSIMNNLKDSEHDTIEKAVTRVGQVKRVTSRLDKEKRKKLADLKVEYERNIKELEELSGAQKEENAIEEKLKGIQENIRVLLSKLKHARTEEKLYRLAVEKNQPLVDYRPVDEGDMQDALVSFNSVYVELNGVEKMIEKYEKVHPDRAKHFRKILEWVKEFHKWVSRLLVAIDRGNPKDL